jgi:hypothetical protein
MTLGCTEHAKVWSGRPLSGELRLRYVPFPLETVSDNIAARVPDLAHPGEMANCGQSRAANCPEPKDHAGNGVLVAHPVCPGRGW